MTKLTPDQIAIIDKIKIDLDFYNGLVQAARSDNHDVDPNVVDEICEAYDEWIQLLYRLLGEAVPELGPR